MPALGFNTVMEFTRAELREWHGAAIDVYRKRRGTE